MNTANPEDSPGDDALFRRFVERLGLRFFFYRHDLEGNFTYLSPSIKDVLGYERDEFQKHYTTYLTDHPVNLEVVKYTDLSIRGIKQPPYRVEIRHKDGSIRWLEVDEHPIRDASGVMIAVEGIAQEISERVASEESLRASEEKLRRIIDYSPLSMALVGMDGTIEYINRCAVETFGYVPEDIPNMDRWWVQAYPDPKYREQVISQWTGLVERAIRENREIEGSDYRVTCKDGTQKDMFIFGIPIMNKVFVMFQDVTARVQAEKSLRMREEQLRSLSDNLADAMVYQIETGEDGRSRSFTYVSAGVTHLHGITPQEALSDPNTIYGQIVEEDRERIATLEEMADRLKSVFRAEARLRMPSGEIRWRQFISTARRTPEGTEVWDGIEIDVTDRKRTEEERSEARLWRDAVLASMPAGLILYGPDGRCLMASESAPGIVGTTADRLLAQNYKQIESWKRSGLSASAEEAMRTGKNTRIVTLVTSTFGKEVWLDARFARIDLHGHPHLMIMFLDITEQKRMEEDRRKTENRYRLLVNSLDVGFFRARNGRFIELNDAVVRMAGYESAEEMAADSAVRLYADPADRERFIEAIKERGSVRGFEVRSVRKDGTLYWVSISATMEQEDEGNTIIGFLEDITTRKTAEEERTYLLACEQNARFDAETAVRARDEFLSIASHDLKTPLSALQIQVEQMAKAACEERLTPEQTVTGLDLAGRQTRRLIRLVRGLLELSRINSGKLILKRDHCNLSELVGEVCERMEPELRRAGCTIEIAAMPDAFGYWDQDRLEQVVENLLANAAKFGAESPIRVAVLAQGQEFRLEIADRGIGIAADHLERIFEPFERGGVSSHYGGMGMGLYIARQIAEAHGGALTVASMPGSGATFTLILPCGNKSSQS